MSSRPPSTPATTPAARAATSTPSTTSTRPTTRCRSPTAARSPTTGPATATRPRGRPAPSRCSAEQLGVLRGDLLVGEDPLLVQVGELLDLLDDVLAAAACRGRRR